MSVSSDTRHAKKVSRRSRACVLDQFLVCSDGRSRTNLGTCFCPFSPSANDAAVAAAVALHRVQTMVCRSPVPLERTQVPERLAVSKNRPVFDLFEDNFQNH